MRHLSEATLLDKEFQVSEILLVIGDGEASKASAALLPHLAQNSPERAAGRRVPETVCIGSPSINVSHRFFKLQ